jgi:hypothetical protein
VPECRVPRWRACSHRHGATCGDGPETLGERTSLVAPFNQPGELLARIAAYPLEEAQHHGLPSSPQAAITEAAHDTGDEVVALFGGHRKIDRHGAFEKGLQLLERSHPAHSALTRMPLSRMMTPDKRVVAVPLIMDA